MNNQDREEHRLAALAAGYEIELMDDEFIKAHEVTSSLLEWSIWHPKTNKADSFDLIEVCGMSVQKMRVLWHATASGQSHTSDDLKLAAFNLAVSIGRSMEEQQSE